MNARVQVQGIQGQRWGAGPTRAANALGSQQAELCVCGLWRFQGQAKNRGLIGFGNLKLEIVGFSRLVDSSGQWSRPVDDIGTSPGIVRFSLAAIDHRAAFRQLDASGTWGVAGCIQLHEIPACGQGEVRQLKMACPI